MKLRPIIIVTAITACGVAQANWKDNKAFDFWQTDGWTMFADDDGIVGPGGGGQKFDAEYLFYKYNATTNDLSIGLQTGFDIKDGHYYSSNYNDDFYAGDLALSFDGNVVLGDTRVTNNSYEYAVDFGLYTEDSTGQKVYSYMSGGSNGIDSAGLYRVGGWDNDISFSSSSPFAMDWGNKITSLSMNDKGAGWVQRLDDASKYNKSFYRQVTFNLDGITGLSDNFTVDAHWTMSCGNDAINGSIQLAQNTGGSTPVPEPSILALFGIGAVGIFSAGWRRRKLRS